MSEINDLLEALENYGNSSIMKLTHSKIKQHKNDILQQLQLPKEVPCKGNIFSLFSYIR